jgi:SAM-dependent methyltransferase
MDTDHLQELVELEDRWHIAKRQLITSLVCEHVPPPARIVEGGVGSARNLDEFQRQGYQVTGLDVLPEAVAQGWSRGVDDVRVHDLGERWPFEEEAVGAVVLLDVLEHMRDPVQVLRHASRVLERHGRVVFTVPAYPWLFGDWDRQLGHYRRYTPAELRSQARAAELKVEWLSYWNAFSMPAAVAVRGFQRCFPRRRPAEFPRVNPIVNNMLLGMAAVERWCPQRCTVPLGPALVGVLAK